MAALVTAKRLDRILGPYRANVAAMKGYRSLETVGDGQELKVVLRVNPSELAYPSSAKGAAGRLEFRLKRDHGIIVPVEVVEDNVEAQTHLATVV